MIDWAFSLFRPPNNWWVAYAALVGGVFFALQISAAVMVMVLITDSRIRA